MSANEFKVDPDLVQQAYKNMLAESQGQVALLQAAATQLQGNVAELQKENEELKLTNQQLMTQSGRQDGVTQAPEPASK